MATQEHPEDFIPDRPLLMIFIGRSIGNDLSAKYPADVYAGVHGYWARNLTTMVDADGNPNRLVLARNTDRVLGVYRVKAWIKSPHEGPDRWGFVGEPADLETQLLYFGKRVPNRFRLQGAQDPVRTIIPGN